MLMHARATAVSRRAVAQAAVWLLLALASVNLAAAPAQSVPHTAAAPADAVVAGAPLRPIPTLTSPATDITGTLDASALTALRERSLALQARKGSQLMLLMVPATAPESIEAYAQRVFEHWKPGRAGIDDGVLVVVAKDERRMRIQVGYGLEQTISDETAARVIDEYLTPAFRDGDYAGGLLRGSDALIGLIDGTPLPEPDNRIPTPVLIFAAILLLPFAAVPLLGMRAAWRRGALAFFGRWALVAVVVAGMLVVTLKQIDVGLGWERWMPLALISYLTTTFTFVTAFGGGVRGDRYEDEDARNRRRRSSSSGSSSDSGYSGGGGRSGGGGASGSW